MKILFYILIILFCFNCAVPIPKEEEVISKRKTEKVNLQNDIRYSKDSISFFLDSIFKLENKIGYKPFLFNDSGSIKLKTTEEIEQLFNKKFPADLNEFFDFSNNINKLNPNTELAIMPLTWILHPAESYYYDTLLRKGFEMVGLRYDVSTSLIPIIRNEWGDFYWYEMEGDKKGHIYYTCTAGDPNSYVYSSLHEFLNTVSVAYKNKVFTLDSTGNLEEDVDKWANLNLKMSKNYKSYWTSYINGF